MPTKWRQAGADVQRLLAHQVANVEPVLDEIDAQYALQPYGRATLAGLRLVQLQHRAQLAQGE